jgi:hypothetical protein
MLQKTLVLGKDKREKKKERMGCGRLGKFTKPFSRNNNICRSCTAYKYSYLSF